MKGKFTNINNNSLNILQYTYIFHTRTRKDLYADSLVSHPCIVFSAKQRRRPRQPIRPPESAKRREDAYKVWSDVEKTRVVFARRGTFMARQGRTYSPSSVKFFSREYINGTGFLLNAY